MLATCQFFEIRGLSKHIFHLDHTNGLKVRPSIFTPEKTQFWFSERSYQPSLFLKMKPSILGVLTLVDQTIEPDASAEVTILTLLLSDQSPKLFLIFFERVLGGSYMEYNLVLFPEYLYQPPNKSC